MDVRIFRPAKSAMQSGTANARRWVMEFEPTAPKVTDPLMGWTGSTDTQGQVRLRFDDEAAAVAFAEKHGLIYRVYEAREQRPTPKSYAANFAHGRFR